MAPSDYAFALAGHFRARFGAEPRLYRAPGRVNVIGEHTDYNDGLVLPAALSQSCWVAASPRTDRRILVHSANLDITFAGDLDGPEPRPTGSWADYPLGVALHLRRAGHDVGGAALLVASDIPMGAGLASSAALEVACGAALCDLVGIAVDPTELARICRRAENEFVGAPCGIMDQFVACHARAGAAVLLDCRSASYRFVAMPPTLRLVACDTMVRHRLAAGPYTDRRAECAAAARLLGVKSLRQVDRAAVDRAAGVLGATLLKRVRHVVSENARVLETADALERGDLATVTGLMAASHRSLRVDFEVSCPELDLLVDLAAAHPGVHGARMTGGGFGGCTVNLVEAAAVGEFCCSIAARYERATGRAPGIYVSEAAGGVARIR